VTEQETQDPDFIPDDLNLFIEKLNVNSRAARSRIDIEWDPDLIPPIMQPPVTEDEPAN